MSETEERHDERREDRDGDAPATRRRRAEKRADRGRHDTGEPGGAEPDSVDEETHPGGGGAVEADD